MFPTITLLYNYDLKKPDFKTIRKRIICIDEYKHDGTHCILYYINKWIIRYLINLFIYSYV